MPGATLPLTYELTIFAGTTFRRDFRWLPDGNVAQDFTGWSANMLIGTYGGRALASLDSNNTGVVLGSDGHVVATMTPTQTAALKAGVYQYALDLTDASGTVTRFMHGRVNVIVDVSP